MIALAAEAFEHHYDTTRKFADINPDFQRLWIEISEPSRDETKGWENMSTRITPEEYKTLVPVPPQNWGVKIFDKQKNCDVWQPHTLGPCDVSPAHGRAHHFLKTPDNRAIAACFKCYEEIKASGANV